MIHVTEIRSFAELCAIRQEWSALWERCGRASPFLSPEWMLPWCRHLFGGGSLWAIAVWDRQGLAGFAPLFIHGNQRREVSLLGSGVTDYLDFLTADDCAGDAMQALCDRLCDSGSSWDRCSFTDIPPGSALLQAYFGRQCAVERTASQVCPFVPLPPDLNTLEGRLSAKFRHGLRNSWNRAQDAGLIFETAAPTQDSEYVEALIRLHAARWQSLGQPGVLGDSAVQDFLREIAMGFRERGWLRWFGVRAGETLRGVLCIFCARGRWLYYLGGFDDQIARYGPGNLLIRFAIEQAISNRAIEFDFLRNREAYKYRWGAADRTSTRIFIRKEVLPRSGRKCHSQAADDSTNPM